MIHFILAGKQNLSEKVYLTSKHRVRKTEGFYNRSKVTTHIFLPLDFYRANFVYNRKTGFYDNDLTWADLVEFMEEEQ